MKDTEANSQKGPNREVTAGGVPKTPLSHFRRNLVPLDEYAAREGLSSDIVEQQGQLGVIQIRKFKGQKYVVDVDPEQLSRFESSEIDETAPATRVSKQLKITSSNLITASLTATLIVIIVGVFWFYLDAKIQLDDLTAEYKALQTTYNNLTISSDQLKKTQNELAASKVQLSQIQNRIAQSKTELEKIQGDLNKARQKLDSIQSELTTIQGQVALSKVELESIGNIINDGRNSLDTLASQNTRATEQ